MLAMEEQLPAGAVPQFPGKKTAEGSRAIFQLRTPAASALAALGSFAVKRRRRVTLVIQVILQSPDFLRRSSITTTGPASEPRRLQDSLRR
jgi:hypothetical protein